MADTFTTPSVDLTLPKENVSTGLAWSYFYGFLNIVLPEFAERVSTWNTKHTLHKLLDKILILVPESCDCRTPLSDYDKEYIKPVYRMDIRKDRAGKVNREYNLDVYEITNPENPEQKLYSVVVLNATVHSMYEMMNDSRTGFTPSDLTMQRSMFVDKLQRIVKESGFTPVCEILTFDDSNDPSKSLARVVFEKMEN